MVAPWGPPCPTFTDGASEAGVSRHPQPLTVQGERRSILDSGGCGELTSSKKPRAVLTAGCPSLLPLPRAGFTAGCPGGLSLSWSVGHSGLSPKPLRVRVTRECRHSPVLQAGSEHAAAGWRAPQGQGRGPQARGGEHAEPTTCSHSLDPTRKVAAPSGLKGGHRGPEAGQVMLHVHAGRLGLDPTWGVPRQSLREATGGSWMGSCWHLSDQKGGAPGFGPAGP